MTWIHRLCNHFDFGKKDTVAAFLIESLTLLASHKRTQTLYIESGGVEAKDRPSSYRGEGVDRVLDADEWKVEERVQTVPEIPPLTLWPQQTSIFSSYPTNVE